MKYLIIVLALFLSACGDPQVLNKKYYPTYGLFNLEDRSENVCYEIIIGNVVWSIILVETIIAPVYFVGWSIYEPVRLKKGPNDKCTIDG